MAAALLALVLALPTPAAAQTEEQSETVTPRLVRQTPWVHEDQPFRMTLSIPGGLPEDATLDLTLYGALVSRDSLAVAAADPAALGPIRSALTVPAELLHADRQGGYHLVLATDGSSSGLPVGDPGVYPLAISVHPEDGTAGPPLLTTVIRAPDDPDDPQLQVAVVLPISAPPATGTDGEVDLRPLARRRVEVRASMLARYPRVPVTVNPTAETLDAVALEDPALLAVLRRTLADRAVLAGPYVRIDLDAWADDRDLASMIEDQLDAGAQALRRDLRRGADRSTLVVLGNATTALLEELARDRVTQAVVRQEAVTSPDGPAPVTEPVVVVGGTGQVLTTYLVDPALRAHVNDVEEPVLAAHRTLADLALLDDAVTDGGVVLELPATRPLPAAYLDALLHGLNAAGPVRAVSLEALFEADPEGEEGSEPGPEVPSAGAPRQSLAAFGRNLAATQATVEGYASFAGRDDPLVADLERRLLVSGSADLSSPARGAHLAGISQAIQDQTALIDIPDDEAVTLTSREGDIPLTIHNDTTGPVEVELHFDSENKLDFPDGATQRLQLAVGPNRIAVPVVARTSGTFPLRITATSPDGTLTVARARLTVRSTAFSGVGLVLSVGALLVLVIWWARHWRTTRRNRRLVARNQLPDPPVRTEREP